MLRIFFAFACGIAGFVMAGPVVSQSVALTDGQFEVQFTLNGTNLTISRNQDTASVLSGEFIKTSRPCPPSCIQPMQAATGVATIGELELFQFLETKVATTNGVLIDARLPEFYATGSIPGAVNVPFSALDPSNPYLGDILKALGATQIGDGLEFSGVMDLVVFCDGPWSAQSAKAVQNLIAAGYPAEKINYYRGGLQDWLILGLTTQSPDSNG